MEEKYLFRGIGEQVITSFIKLQVPRTFGLQGVHNASNIIDHWLETTNCFRGDSSIHLCPGDFLAGDTVARNQSKVDGDERQAMCW